MTYSIHNLTIVKYNPQFTYEVIMSHWGFIGVAAGILWNLRVNLLRIFVHQGSSEKDWWTELVRKFSR